jgi:nonsense-mediated mRNA decay protein 3
VDAVWIWTESHSLRLQIKLTIQKEVVNGAILQQATVVEYVIRNQQCKVCQSYYAQGVWQAVVQVRQHVSHKRTFYYLEQLLLKNNAHADCLQIMVSLPHGSDPSSPSSLFFLCVLSIVLSLLSLFHCICM